MGDDSTKETPHFMRRFLYSSRLLHIVGKRWKWASAAFVCLLLAGGWYLYSGPSYLESTNSNLQPSAVVGKPNAPAEPRSSVSGGQGNERLFYNRVPKCGSSTLVSLLKKLASRNSFNHIQSPLLDDWSLFMPAQQVSVLRL